jgi:hypothetical protein
MLKLAIATIDINYEFNLDTDDLNNGLGCRLAISKTCRVICRANTTGFNHCGLLFITACYDSGGIVVCRYRPTFVPVYLARCR